MVYYRQSLEYVTSDDEDKNPKQLVIQNLKDIHEYMLRQRLLLFIFSVSGIEQLYAIHANESSITFMVISKGLPEPFLPLNMSNRRTFVAM